VGVSAEIYGVGSSHFEMEIRPEALQKSHKFSKIQNKKENRKSIIASFSIPNPLSNINSSSASAL
jgi:hypothetical protein